HITDIISKFVPFFIFFVILNLIWSNELHVILSMWKPYLTFTVLLIVIHLFMLAIVSMRESVSFITLFKKILPTFLIGLGTASSTALSGECADCLTKRLGINSRLVEFGHPIGYVIFMPYTAVNFLVCAFYMAHYYKVQVSLLWLVIGVLLCAFVAIATPPVPGGAIAAYTVIFTQLGLPHQAIAIMISTDILFDFLATAFDSTILQLAMVRLADKTGMLDFETLRRPVSLRKGKLK
ncbi:MAG: cation:dicarboxylase symporter family transporter, partial [Clostridia bacterium]|nr:cation:dicarboxylase symporter family transporter [Clostridia bacterium]